MKRVILHKAMPAVADCTDSSTPNEQPKQAQRNQLTSNSGKAGASVAMIGLAMSVGASSLLLPQTGDAAIAVEPLISNESATEQLLGSPNFVTPKTVVESGLVTNVTENQEPMRLAASNADQSAWLSNHQVPQNRSVEILGPKSPQELGASGTYLPVIPDVLPESQQNQKSEKNSNDWSGSILSRLRGDTSSNALPNQSALLDKGISETAEVEAINSAGDQTIIKPIENPGNILEAAGPNTTLNQGNKSSVIQLEIQTDENAYQNNNDSDVKLLDTDDQAIKKSTLDKELSHQSENNSVEALKDGSSITDSISANSSDNVLETNKLLGTVSLPPITTPEIVALKSDRTTYRVRAGDTLDEIAQKYAVSVSDLIEINQILDPNYLLPGQSLTIPASFKSSDEVKSVEIAVPHPVNLQGTSNQSLPDHPEVVISGETPSLINQANLPQTVPVDSNGLVIPMGGSSAEIVSEPQIVNEPTLAQPEIISVNPIDSSESNAGLSEVELGAAQKSPYNDRLNADLARLKATSEPVAIALEVPQVPVVPTQIDLRTRQKEISRPESQLLTRREATRRGESSTRLEPIVPTEVRIVTPNAGNIQVTPNVISANVNGNYDRFNNLSINRMVSPELPPLLSPDAYLPSNNGGYLPHRQNQPISNGGYIWPAEGVLTSGYGWRWGRMHRGIDIAAPIGTPIYAAKEGEVVFADWSNGGYGYMVEIRHPDGSNTIYAHNDRILVQKGQIVEQGQQISEMGTTGRSTGPHLHFEIDPDGQGAVDPLAYLPNSRSE